MRGFAGTCEGSLVIRISLEQASQNDKLAKPVFDMDGKMLLNSGVELNEAYLARLLEHGVSEVYVRAPNVHIAAGEDAISDASRIELMACAHACVLAAQDNAALPARRVIEALEGACDDARRMRDMTAAVSPARSGRDWWEVHARNVAVLCVVTAQAIGLGQAEISHVGVGGLLHDVGLVGLSAEPLCTPQQEVQAAGRGHPALGFQALIVDPGISANSAVVCLQHHERRDGSGFPKGLAGDHISLAAQVCAVADTYDLLIAPAPFGSGVMPHLALRQLRAHNDLASPEALDAFMQAAAPYPPGTMLRLSDATTAVVAEPCAAGATAVRVCIVGNNGAAATVDLDLARDAGVKTVEVL